MKGYGKTLKYFTQNFILSVIKIVSHKFTQHFKLCWRSYQFKNISIPRD